MNNVMIDLETLDTVATSKIVAIGAIVFNPNTGLRGDKFYSLIDHKSQTNRTKSKSTVAWWKTQPAEVKKQLKGTLPLKEVLEDFEFWLPEKCIVWACPGKLDIAMLDHAYAQIGSTTPWMHWATMCGASIRKLYEEKRGGLDQNFNGTKHHALDDAIYQAGYISKMWRELKR